MAGKDDPPVPSGTGKGNTFKGRFRNLQQSLSNHNSYAFNAQLTGRGSPEADHDKKNSSPSLTGMLGKAFGSTPKVRSASEHVRPEGRRVLEVDRKQVQDAMQGWISEEVTKQLGAQSSSPAHRSRRPNHRSSSSNHPRRRHRHRRRSSSASSDMEYNVRITSSSSRSKSQANTMDAQPPPPFGPNASYQMGFQQGVVQGVVYQQQQQQPLVVPQPYPSHPYSSHPYPPMANQQPNPLYQYPPPMPNTPQGSYMVVTPQELEMLRAGHPNHPPASNPVPVPPAAPPAPPSSSTSAVASSGRRTSATVTATVHTCLGCGKNRSRRYHRRNPIIPGVEPTGDYCRKCQQDETTSPAPSTEDEMPTPSRRAKAKQKEQPEKTRRSRRDTFDANSYDSDEIYHERRHSSVRGKKYSGKGTPQRPQANLPTGSYVRQSPEYEEAVRRQRERSNTLSPETERLKAAALKEIRRRVEESPTPPNMRIPIIPIDDEMLVVDNKHLDAVRSRGERSTSSSKRRRDRKTPYDAGVYHPKLPSDVSSLEAGQNVVVERTYDEHSKKVPIEIGSPIPRGEVVVTRDRFEGPIHHGQASRSSRKHSSSNQRNDQDAAELERKQRKHKSAGHHSKNRPEDDYSSDDSGRTARPRHREDEVYSEVRSQEHRRHNAAYSPLIQHPSPIPPPRRTSGIRMEGREATPEDFFQDPTVTPVLVQSSPQHGRGSVDSSPSHKPHRHAGRSKGGHSRSRKSSQQSPSLPSIDEVSQVVSDDEDPEVEAAQRRFKEHMNSIRPDERSPQSPVIPDPKKSSLKSRSSYSSPSVEDSTDFESESSYRSNTAQELAHERGRKLHMVLRAERGDKSPLHPQETRPRGESNASTDSSVKSWGLGQSLSDYGPDSPGKNAPGYQKKITGWGLGVGLKEDSPPSDGANWGTFNTQNTRFASQKSGVDENARPAAYSSSPQAYSADEWGMPPGVGDTASLGSWGESPNVAHAHSPKNDGVGKDPLSPKSDHCSPEYWGVPTPRGGAPAPDAWDDTPRQRDSHKGTRRGGSDDSSGGRNGNSYEKKQHRRRVHGPLIRDDEASYPSTYAS